MIERRQNSGFVLPTWRAFAPRLLGDKRIRLGESLKSLAMSRRSPNYPSIDLGAAIDAMRTVFFKQQRTAMSRDKLMQHLAGSSLSGRAHTIVAAVRAYGLVEGKRHEMRVSDDMAIILEAPKDSVERRRALTRCAFHSTAFQQIASQYGNDHPSELDLRRWLARRHFTAAAVGRLTANYLATMRLVAEEGIGYQLLEDNEGENFGMLGASERTGQDEDATQVSLPSDAAPVPRGSRREIITLAEGDVTITFPERFSIESYEDLAASLELFLRKARRRAALPRQV